MVRVADGRDCGCLGNNLNADVVSMKALGRWQGLFRAGLQACAVCEENGACRSCEEASDNGIPEARAPCPHRPRRYPAWWLHRWLLGGFFAGLIAGGGWSSWAGDLSFGSPESAGFTPGHLKRVDAEMAKHVVGNRLSGIVVLIARRGQVSYLKAAGQRDIEAGLPMETNTLFRIASMSKLVTSVGMMMLIDQGAARLDDPVSKYIPEFAKPQVIIQGDPNRRTRPSIREITLRHLMTHTSGITYRFNGQVPLAAIYAEAGVCDGLAPCEGTLGDMVRVLARQPLWFNPGSAYEYGLSTDVLGRVIEVVSGMPLDLYLKERIFDPLGMADTSFHVPEGKLGRLAAVYGPATGGGLRRIPDHPFTTNGWLVCSPSHVYPRPGTYFSGGAGLVSSALDYARLLQTLLNGGELGGSRLLSSRAVLQLTTNALGNLVPGFNAGLGSVGVTTTPAMGEWVGSFGWGGFWNTTFHVDPTEQLVAVLLTQLYPADRVASWDTDVIRAAYEAIGESRIHVSPTGAGVNLRWRLPSLVPKPGRQMIPGWALEESAAPPTWQPWGSAVEASLSTPRTMSRAVTKQPDARFFRLRLIRDFTGRELPGARLLNADLRGTILKNANLEGADLSQGDLRGADLTGTRMKNANLSEANLEGAIGFDAEQEGIAFRNTILPDGSLRAH